MNNRRKLLVALGAASFTPQAVFAQSKQPILIGWLNGGSGESGGPYLAAFKEGLAALGWKEGSNFVIEQRWAEGQTARLRPLADELAASKPVIIVAAPLQAVANAAKAAPKIPIVMATGGDPTVTGLVKSLARPGGMVTGVTNLNISITEKYLELLLVAAPKSRRVGFLFDVTIPNLALQKENARRSVAQHPVEMLFAEVARPEEIEPALSRLAKEGVQALVVMPGQILGVGRWRIVKFAQEQRWPIIANIREFADAGALLSYGIDTSANYRRAAYFVDRILKGTKPGDLPIEQPTKFELVINLKTAKALKLEISRELAVRADRVIE